MMAKCKCGKSEMYFRNIPLKDIDGKWECPHCKKSDKRKEALKEMTKLGQELEAESKAADVNEDGKVDEKDLSIVHKEYAAEKKKKPARKKRSKKKSE